MEDRRYPICCAAYNADAEQRRLGTSGSMFSAVATAILNHGGVVSAAAYDEGVRSVKHIVIDDLSDLPQLCGSKYVESDFADALRTCKELLAQGRSVFFVGTPCQIAALNKLTNRPANLLTADLVCHGVSTANVWRSYLKYESDRCGSKVTACTFRNKSKGWNLSHTTISFENRKRDDSISNNNPYMAAFYSGLSLRASCLNCSIAKNERVGDLTFGDCWHVGKMIPRMDDNRGTSLLLVNTGKGRLVVDDLLSNGAIVCEPYSLETARYNNSALTKHAVVDAAARRIFLSRIEAGDLNVWKTLIPLKKRLRHALVYFVKSMFCKLHLAI